MANVHNVRIQYLYDTEENWISKDPQLSSNGEAYIFETPDGCRLKIGDGVISKEFFKETFGEDYTG